jgi:hypothetical protein
MKWVAQLEKGASSIGHDDDDFNSEYLSMELESHVPVKQPSIVTLADCTVHNTVGRQISRGIQM